MKIDFTQSALGDLTQILSYYREQNIPEIGLNFVSQILKQSERLAKYPDSGRLVPEFGIHFLREILMPPFRIVYRRDPNRIWIIRVWRSERLLNLE